MAAVQELESVINPFKYWGLAAGRGLGPCFFLVECVSQSLVDSRCEMHVIE